jgi:hypothetical protein
MSLRIVPLHTGLFRRASKLRMPLPGLSNHERREFRLTGDYPAIPLEYQRRSDRVAHPNSRGDVTIQRFCAVCKTRLYSTNEGRSGTAVIRAGTLDDSGALVPTVHMWAKRKQAWIGLPLDTEIYDEAIPPDRAKISFAANFI